jgi:hypothetical protein
MEPGWVIREAALYGGEVGPAQRGSRGTRTDQPLLSGRSGAIHEFRCLRELIYGYPIRVFRLPEDAGDFTSLHLTTDVSSPAANVEGRAPLRIVPARLRVG